MTDLEVAKKLTQIANSANSRGIFFDLSFKKMKQLLKRKKCHYTRDIFTEEEGPKHKSIDRIDNSKGYIDSNVVACTVEINQKKRELSIIEIKQLYKVVKNL